MSETGPFKVGQRVRMLSAATRYYVKHSVTFPHGMRGEIVNAEYDEHLSSRAYRDCWLYEIKSDEGNVGWFTDLDVESELTPSPYLPRLTT